MGIPTPPSPNFTSSPPTYANSPPPRNLSQTPSASSPPPTKKRKVAKRACDGCKIRKIKCSAGDAQVEVACEGCRAVGIECTFRKRQDRRGPRSLRARTLGRINAGSKRDGCASGDGVVIGDCGCGSCGREEEEEEALNLNASSERAVGGDQYVGEGDEGAGVGVRMSKPPQIPIPNPTTSTRTPLNSLVLKLCIYRLRLYPIWPIVAVEEIMASLQLQSTSHSQTTTETQIQEETYALANAIGAATIAQLKLTHSSSSNSTSSTTLATHMASESERTRLPHTANLNGLRTAFFLHVYHENLEPGGIRSLLFLREAITMAQVMGLHREGRFSRLGLEGREGEGEEEVRRRVVWLLFVTERGVAMLHHLPPILKPTTSFPSLHTSSEETNIMPAFLQLINLFRIFDQSGAFDMLQTQDSDVDNFHHNPNHISLALLRQKLQEIPITWGHASNDVQTADICVTRQWMQAVLWKVSMRSRNENVHGSENGDEGQITSLQHPVQIAREFLNVINLLPNAAIEAHGPSMEYKIFEIASAVTDALLSTTTTTTSHPFPLPLPLTYHRQPSINHLNTTFTTTTTTTTTNSPPQELDPDPDPAPQTILDQLLRLLASSRGGNSTLSALLKTKINHINKINKININVNKRIHPHPHPDQPQPPSPNQKSQVDVGIGIGIVSRVEELDECENWLSDESAASPDCVGVGIGVSVGLDGMSGLGYQGEVLELQQQQQQQEEAPYCIWPNFMAQPWHFAEGLMGMGTGMGRVEEEGSPGFGNLEGSALQRAFGGVAMAGWDGDEDGVGGNGNGLIGDAGDFDSGGFG